MKDDPLLDLLMRCANTDPDEPVTLTCREVVALLHEIGIPPKPEA